MLNYRNTSAILVVLTLVFLATGIYTKSVSVDLNRLNESHEAWIYVELSNIPNISEFSKGGDVQIVDAKGPIYGFNGCKAVLTWDNSD